MDDPGPVRPAVRNTAKRVVIVDDSPFMRMWLCHVLNNDTRLDVVGEASNAQEARCMVRALKPDVITLDIDMPGMSGLDFLDRLMKLNPLPVVMVSGDTAKGSAATVRSLALGAVDCIVKPELHDMNRTKRDLVRRIFAAACSRVQRQVLPSKGYSSPARPDPYSGAARMPIVLIGASTGGVAALNCVLQALHPAGPPVVIVQHMPPEFLVSFSEMLNRHLQQEVGLIEHGAALRAGQVMLAPATGTRHTRVTRSGHTWYAQIGDVDTPCLHHPSVDVLFDSACEYAPDTIAVMLTGLGGDGAQGMKNLSDAGAQTIGQDEQTSVVYGMPCAAFELGGVQSQIPLDQIGDAVNRLVQKHRDKQRGSRA